MPTAESLSLSTEWVLSNGLSLVTALVVFIVGWYLSSFLSRRVADLLHRTPRLDRTIRPLIAELIRYSILGVTLVIVLGQFGVQTTSILAILGAIGLAVALALQGTLSNIAAGVMLLWLRPFNVGETIESDDMIATVVEIGLFATRLKSYDGIFIFMPNSNLWNARIRNFSREATRMVEIKIGIAYEANIQQARDALLAAAKDDRVFDEPAPTVFVAGLGASSVNLTLRVWVAGPNWWPVNIDLTERCKLALDSAGIEIPYNKLDVTLNQAN